MGEVTVRRDPYAPEFASWVKAYLIAGMILLFGLLPQVVGGGESIDQVERDCRALVADGQPVQATVRRKWGDSNYQSIEYSFVMDGKTYWGLSDPGKAEWLQLSVGDTIRVLYLPSNPDVTEYHPERWLAQQQNTGTIGWIISGVGLAALLLIGALDLARRSGSHLAEAIDSPSRPIAGLIVGLIFFGAGMFFQIKILTDILSGVPMPFTISSGSRVVSQGFAEGWQLWLMGLFPIPFWGIGLYFLSKWRAG